MELVQLLKGVMMSFQYLLRMGSDYPVRKYGWLVSLLVLRALENHLRGSGLMSLVLLMTLLAGRDYYFQLSLALRM